MKNKSLRYPPCSSFNKIIITMVFIILLISLNISLTGCTSMYDTATTISSLTTITANTPKLSITMTPRFNYTLTPSILQISTYDFSQTVEKRITLSYIIDDPSISPTITSEKNTNDTLDLDTMVIENTSRSDIQFFVSVGTMRWFLLYAINGAQSESKGTGNITLEDCIDKTVPTYQFKPDAFIGNHICYISNKNQLFLVYIENITDTFELASITLLITTPRIN